LTLGDLIIDIRDRSVSRAGEPMVGLVSEEFAS